MLYFPYMESKKSTVFLFSLLAILSAVIIVSMFMTSNGGRIDPAKLFANDSTARVDQTAIPRVSASDHARGAQNPKITWVEYGDFECPFCKQQHDEFKKLLAAYPNDVQIVFRHFPLDIHPGAVPKAIAAECAAKLGGETAFWRYHDMLYDRANIDGTGVEEDQLPVFAQELGLNVQSFIECQANPDTARRVQGDVITGRAATVEATPTSIIINEQNQAVIVPGAVQFEQMEEIMNYFNSEL